MGVGHFDLVPQFSHHKNERNELGCSWCLSKTMFGAFSFRKNWPKKNSRHVATFCVPIPSAICSVPWHHTLQICGVGLHMFLPGLVCGVVEPIISRKITHQIAGSWGSPSVFPYVFPFSNRFLEIGGPRVPALQTFASSSFPGSGCANDCTALHPWTRKDSVHPFGWNNFEPQMGNQQKMDIHKPTGSFKGKINEKCRFS